MLPLPSKHNDLWSCLRHVAQKFRFPLSGLSGRLRVVFKGCPGVVMAQERSCKIIDNDSMTDASQ
jgi:hypothetical protein